MIEILASNGTTNGIGMMILAGLALAGIIICIKIAVIIAIIKYIAKEIGKAVSNNFDYDYMAKMVAYEMKKSTTKVVPKKIEAIEHSDPE